MDLTCKFCGSELHSSSSILVSKGGNSSCSKSPTKKHIAVPNPPYCVYCGAETHNSSQTLVSKGGNSSCRASPTKNISLQNNCFYFTTDYAGSLRLGKQQKHLRGIINETRY